MITLPSTLDDEGLLNLLAALRAHEADKEVEVTLGGVEFAEPHATLVAATAIKAWRERREEAGLETRYLVNGRDSRSESAGAGYLAHVGFYRLLGVPFGKSPGEATGSSTYVPIRELTWQELGGERRELSAILDGVEREAYALARVACKDEEAQEILAYCFREAIRNVFEHSMADRCLIMAQRYGRLGYVELVVADRGRGVHASLSEAYPGISADNAVQRAIEPGVTRVVRDTGMGKWENAGYGLYVLSELGRAGGVFSLWSSDLILFATGDATTCVGWRLPGTVLRLKVSLEDAEYFPNLLADIVARGEARQSPDTPIKSGDSKSRARGAWISGSRGHEG